MAVLMRPPTSGLRGWIYRRLCWWDSGLILATVALCVQIVALCLIWRITAKPTKTDRIETLEKQIQEIQEKTATWHN